MSYAVTEAREVQRQIYNDTGMECFGQGSMQEALMRKRISIARKYMEPLDGTILDIGCGNGDIVRDLTSRGKRILGVDLADLRLRALKNQSGDSYVCGLAEELPFKRDSISGIISFELIEHLHPDVFHSFLGNIKRVLKTGGVGVFSTPNPEHFSVRQTLGLPPITDDRPDHFNILTQGELKRNLNENNLSVIEMYGLGIIPGMWYMQKLFPFAFIQDLNLSMGKACSRKASETVVVFQNC